MHHISIRIGRKAGLPLAIRRNRGRISRQQLWGRLPEACRCCRKVAGHQSGTDQKMKSSLKHRESSQLKYANACYWVINRRKTRRATV